MGVDPAEALYVGDNPEKDVDPAHEAGLMTCLRRGKGKHGRSRGRQKADFVVEDLRELLPRLEERFGIVCD